MAENKKLGATMSDGELEQVAGGSSTQNAKLFSLIAQLDPSEKAFIEKSVDFGSADWEEHFATAVQGAMNRILKSKGINGTVTARAGGDGYTNTYIINGKSMSHENFVYMMSPSGNDF